VFVPFHPSQVLVAPVVPAPLDVASAALFSAQVSSYTLSIFGVHYAALLFLIASNQPTHENNFCQNIFLNKRCDLRR